LNKRGFPVPGKITVSFPSFFHYSGGMQRRRIFIYEWGIQHSVPLPDVDTAAGINAPVGTRPSGKFNA